MKRENQAWTALKGRSLGIEQDEFGSSGNPLHPSFPLLPTIHPFARHANRDGKLPKHVGNPGVSKGD
jgi:hypothetical protein